MDVLEEFISHLKEGDIHFRDNLQFELKSEFFIHPNVKKNIYKQDFYLFIPNALQINSYNYSKEQFYSDETNLIRYKTPRISLESLTQKENTKSPLVRLEREVNTSSEKIDYIFVIDELKLFGNIFNAALRDQIQLIFLELEKNSREEDLVKNQINWLCSNIKEVRKNFIQIQKDLDQISVRQELKTYFQYTDEFISLTIEYYLVNLLRLLRDLPFKSDETVDKQLCEILVEEQKYRHRYHEEAKDRPHTSEAILYRSSLLNKFMLEALQLNSNRLSLKEKHQNLLGAIAAGIAMFVYSLLLWKSTVFAINSLPFVILAVIFYILKDRIKEGLKNLYHRQAFRWLPDYSTEITNRKGQIIGKLNEHFSFIEEEQIPAEILRIRDKNFHDELPALKRQETVIHYKREVTLQAHPSLLESRRRELTMIFRLSIQAFLEKASDALEPNLKLNNYTLNIIERLLPKVYHINIIIQNTYLQANEKSKTEFKKFRVVIDKFGIKRIEQIK